MDGFYSLVMADRLRGIIIRHGAREMSSVDFLPNQYCSATEQLALLHILEWMELTHYHGGY